MLLPHLIFLIVLLINTYFSVRFFMPLLPRLPSQWVIDTLLVLNYLTLAFFLGQAFLFPLSAAVLFMLASAKYVLALGYADTHLLKKKMLIDMLGVLLCSVCAGLVVAGYPSESAWLLAGVFVLANIYLLVINPMYGHEKTG